MSAAARPKVTDAYEMVIGLEVHCQLKTRTKAFCGCRTSFGDAPNANTCPVCLGLPGALPVLNAQAVQLATKASLALDCTVHGRSIFARKNYFYPDLPKGYQISQFDHPLATAGQLDIGLTKDGEPVVIRITRVHMEEDAGKSVHDRFKTDSAIDLNRSGTPLVEIVSEPDIRSAAEAGAYVRTLKQILEYVDVSDANMEEGSLRVDVNISARVRGATALGTRTEVKNLNTISGVEHCIDIEFARQCGVLAAGGTIVQQTMLWDGHKEEIRPARSKEASHDYRYFPEPDLPPLVLAAEWIAAQQEALPELPQARRARFASQYGIPAVDIEVLTATTAMAQRFETIAATSGDARRAANWVLGPLQASANASGVALEAHPVSATHLGELIRLEVDGKLSNSAARQVFAIMEADAVEPRQAPLAIAEREGLLKVSDDTALQGWIDEVLADYPDEARRFLDGELKLQGVLVGHVMRKSKGSADPKRLNQLLGARRS
ncbi:MAG: Asp-tRNA(Asn)/Glu-tRNA(Gln) amidotransferase subunit GatB [Phycisphaerae bacterium]|nr:Asp-tRNA(Asn)/Glu-tRNA(Gln) amidotransferase subunit GatB [Gemmatimonadaceae bacterium]